jgi:hypothetical protein
VLFDESNGLEQLIDATLAVRNEHRITAVTGGRQNPRPT